MGSSSQAAKQTANKINSHLERLIPFSTPFAVLLGYFLPGVFIHLRPYVILLFGIMTFSGALKLKAAEMGNAVRKPLPIIMFFVSAHIIMPVIAFFVTGLFFKEPDIVTGFVLLFAGPAAVSGFFWILIFNGDKALALSIILLDTILAPLVVPGTLSVLIGQTVSMDMSGIAVSLVLMVVVPTIIGVGINEASKGKAPPVISPYLDPFSKICLMLVIAANASAVASKINFKDPLVWKTGIICILMISFGFALIYAISILIKCKGEKGISILVCSGLKNNSATMTLAVSFFNDVVALPIIMSLLFQQVIMAVVGKRLFAKDLAQSRRAAEIAEK